MEKFTNSVSQEPPLGFILLNIFISNLSSRTRLWNAKMTELSAWRRQDRHTGRTRWPSELENWMEWNLKAKSAPSGQEKLRTRISPLNWWFISCKKQKRRKLVNRMIIRYQCVAAVKRSNEFLGHVRHFQLTQKRTTWISYKIVWRLLITCVQNKTRKCVQKGLLRWLWEWENNHEKKQGNLGPFSLVKQRLSIYIFRYIDAF